MTSKHESSRGVGFRSTAASAPRFRAFCVGLPKTGTTSIAELFSPYRSAHEYQFEDACAVIAGHRRGSVPHGGLRQWVRERLQVGLEMDSASFNWLAAAEFARESEDARFILTIRDCFSWLESLLNMLLFLGPELRDWMLEFGRDVFGVTLRRSDVASRAALLDAAPRLVVPALALWSEGIRTVLDAIPTERLLIVRTDRIAAEIARIAAFVGVSAGSLAASRSHAFAAPSRAYLLSGVDTGLLRSAADEHTGELMARLFPQVDLEGFLYRNFLLSIGAGGLL